MVHAFNRKLGYTRIARSLFIAKRCDALAVEGYKTAIHEIKTTTLNTNKYNYALENLNAVLRSQNRSTLPADQDWINETQNRNKAILDTLENELKAAKTNIVKEDIRVKIGKYCNTNDDILISLLFFFFIFVCRLLIRN